MNTYFSHKIAAGFMMVMVIAVTTAYPPRAHAQDIDYTELITDALTECTVGNTITELLWSLAGSAGGALGGALGGLTGGGGGGFGGGGGGGLFGGGSGGGNTGDTDGTAEGSGQSEVPVWNDDQDKKQQAQNQKSHIIDCIAYAAAGSALDQTNESVVDWANSGFDSSDNPFYVEDRSEFFKDLGQETAEITINEIESELPSDYRTTVNDNLEDRYRTKDYAAAFDCEEGTTDLSSISTTINPNAGWETYLQTMTDSGCTAAGADYLAGKITRNRIAQASNDAQQQLNQNNGFLDEKENGRSQTPGSVIQDQLNNTLEKGLDKTVESDELSELISQLLTNSILQLADDGLSSF